MTSHRGFVTSRRTVAAEPLEKRTLLAADFAFVGISGGVEQETELLWGEGTLADNGVVTGSLMRVAFGQLVEADTLPFNEITLGPGGAMTVTAAPGEPALTGQAGGNPFSALGYGLGFLSTDYSTTFGAAGTDLWMIEKRGPLPGDWTREFEFRAVRITAGGMDVVEGAFTFLLDTAQQPTAVSWEIAGEAAVEKDIVSISDDGKVVLDSGEVIFITTNADNETLSTIALVADLNSFDGEILAGIGGAGTTFNLGNSSQYLDGLYRGMGVSEGAGAEFLGGEGANPFVLDLHHDGTFRLYDAFEYDQGGRDAVTTGTWRVSQSSEFPTYAFNRVLLTSGATGNVAVFAVQEDFTLVGESVRDGDGTVLAQLAAGARTFLPLDHEILANVITVDLDDQGRPILYHLSYTGTPGEADVWYSLDLIARAGGKPLMTVEILETDASTSTHIVAGVATDGHAVTWERDVRGHWIFRDLTDEFAGEGATPIVADAAVYRGVRLTHERLYIAGTQASGDLVSYEPVGARDEFGVERWAFTNVTLEELAPFGESTPEWQPGTVTGFGTNWGALNIVGLNVVGQIVAAWTAPGADRWFVNNLSDIAGTVPLAGGLMTYVTDWNAIHINGISPDGRLIVTWWAPSNGSLWYSDDLTARFNGPFLPPTLAGGAPNTPIFFEGVDGALNVAAIDTNGDAVVYWWPIGAPEWRTGNLTASVPDAERPARLTGAATHPAVNFEIELATQQSVFGLDDQGDLVRLYWDDHLPDQWFEDIAGTAVELPV